MTEGTIQATLRRKGGETLAELALPKSLSQVPLNRFIDFLVECRSLTDDDKNPAVVMARAISGFLDYPLIEIIEAEVGDIFSPEIKGLDKGISQVFGYIANMVSKAKGELVDPDNAVFDFQGYQYRIPVIMQQALKGEVQLPYISVIETVEASEIQRFKIQKTRQVGDPQGLIRQQILAVAEAEAAGLDERDPTRLALMKAADKVASQQVERLGDPSGSLLYSMYLKMLAVLCRREGEQMPFDDAEREVWINDRAVQFKAIDAQKALNIDFFLTSILQSYDETLPAVGFLSRQSFAVVAATRLKSLKPMKGRRPTTKRYSNA